MTKKLNINIFTFILISIFLITLINDYVTFFININYLMSLFGSFIIYLLCFYGLKKHIKIQWHIFNKTDTIFYIVIASYFILSIVYPDISFDTVNYHLYLQENPFGNKISYDFFAGKNLNSFSYAFPDRIHYIFRYFLGYRLGVIVNYLILIVLFYQTKNLFKKYIKTSDMTLSIISMLSVFSLSIVDLVDNYYIDLFSLVVLMEIITRILNENYLSEKKYINSKIIYLALLFGFSLAIKISNAPLLLLLFIIFLFKTKFSFKKISLKQMLLIILTGILPFILYMIYTYLSTGNPVFPFYNTIFKSEYFSLTNWMDTRFGPDKLIEKLIWPIFVIFVPNRGVDQAIVEYSWSYGYILSIIYIIITIIKFLRKKEINKSLLDLTVLHVGLSIVWSSYQLGYTRYGLIVLLISNIITYIFLIKIFNRKKYVLFYMFLLIIVANYNYSVNYLFNSGQYWIFNNVFNNNGDYKNNLSKVLKDRNKNIKLPENSVWGIINYNGGYASLINDEKPIININSSVSNEKTERIFNDLTNNKKIYSFTDVLNFDNFFNYLKQSNYYIEDYYKSYNLDFLDSNEKLYIFKISKNDKIESNYYNVNTQYILKIKENTDSLKFYYGLPKNLFKTMKEGYTLQIELKKDNIITKIDLLNIKDSGELSEYNKNIRLEKDDEIIITIKNKDYKDFSDDRWFMLIMNEDKGDA